MERKDIGSCQCPLCGRDSRVRKFENGRRKGQLYVICPVHRQTMNPGSDFQNWILERAQMYGPDGKPPEVPTAEPAPHVAPEIEAHVAQELPTPTKAQVRDRGGFFPLFGL